MKRTIEEFKEKAVVVTIGMETFFPQFKLREKLFLTGLEPEKFKKKYSYNNSVVAFVDEEGTFYVIPDLQGLQKVLKENGYTRDYFYVPFSNWDYPVMYENKWRKLWEEKNAGR